MKQMPVDELVKVKAAPASVAVPAASLPAVPPCAARGDQEDTLNFPRDVSSFRPV